MAKINEYFLKSIFQEKEIDIEEKLLTSAISTMASFVAPTLEMDENYNYFYSVDFDDLKNTDIDEEQAFGLRQHGWIMDESEKHIIKRI